MWSLTGTASQNALVQAAIDRSDMDWSKLLPSLQREGKTQIRVEWADLSRFGQAAVALRAHGGGERVTDENGQAAIPVEREVEGRRRVLGLFYLPPHTRVVLDFALEQDPILTQRVFIAEGAHAVDYHVMTAEHRRLFINSLHTQQLPVGADVSDGAVFDLDGHACSWFDGKRVDGQLIAYRDWIGETFMQGFIEATTDLGNDFQLGHPVGPEDRSVIRQFLGVDVPAPALRRVFRSRRTSLVVHGKHWGVSPVEWFDSLAAAQVAGLRGCRVCRPT